MNQTIRYQTTECSRCGGTGSYSFNSKDGTECFRCFTGKGVGTGLQLTKDAIESRDKVGEFKSSILTIRADEVEVGMKVEVNNHRGTVQQVTFGRVTSNGVPLLSIHLRYIAVAVLPEDSVLRQATDEEWTRIIDFAGSLPGVDIIEKISA